MDSHDPIVLFGRWFESAKKAGIDKPHACALATAGDDRQPSCRMVLLSSYDDRGFVFHTNYRSRKGAELAQNARAALTFWWDPLGYQVRIEGQAEMTTPTESDSYFAQRPRGSQIGAWASAQSSVITGPEVLHDAVTKLQDQYTNRSIPRPPHWGGYRLLPQSIEFWINRDDRLHDRLRFERTSTGAWSAAHLAP